MPEGIWGGLGAGLQAGLAPTAQDYADALARYRGAGSQTDGGWTDTTGQNNTLPPSARGVFPWIARQLGLAGNKQPPPVDIVGQNVGPVGGNFSMGAPPQYGPPVPPPAGTGTTQGQRPVTFTPPPYVPPPTPAPWPASPLNVGGNNALVSAPASPGGYGYFGDITRMNPQQRRQWALGNMNMRGSPWSANYGA